jgi:carbon storage regulator
MLVLTRKMGETIIIDNNGKQIEIVVLENRKGQVRLGISAPRDIEVHRYEIWEKLQAQKNKVESLTQNDNN